MLRRPRRNRKTEGIRSLIRQTKVTTDDLIFPLFLIEGYNQKQEVKSMPGIYRLTPDLMLKEIEHCMGLGSGHLMCSPLSQRRIKLQRPARGIAKIPFI